MRGPLVVRQKRRLTGREVRYPNHRWKSYDVGEDGIERCVVHEVSGLLNDHQNGILRIGRGVPFVRRRGKAR